jgi:dynein heavy chain
MWTEEVGDAFNDLSEGNESAMKECLVLLKNRLIDLINKVRTDLSFLERGKIINIITIDVHGRDVVDKFINKKVTESESFDWLSQLKFYYEDKENDMHTR